MEKYRVMANQEGLFVVNDAQNGVPFDCLAAAVSVQPGLSEFERFRAAKMIRSACREPVATMTPIEDLTRAPVFSLQDEAVPNVECSLEMFLTRDSGAEFRFGLSSSEQGQGSEQLGTAQITLSKKEMMAFLNFFALEK